MVVVFPRISNSLWCDYWYAPLYNVFLVVYAWRSLTKMKFSLKIQLRPSPPQTGPLDPLVWTSEISCVSWPRPPYLEWGGKFRLNWAPTLCWSTLHWVLFSSLGKVSWERSAIWPDLYCSLAKLFSSLLFLLWLSFSPVCCEVVYERKSPSEDERQRPHKSILELVPQVSSDHCLWTNFASCFHLQMIQRLPPYSCLCVPALFYFICFKSRKLVPPMFGDD